MTEKKELTEEQLAAITVQEKLTHEFISVVEAFQEKHGVILQYAPMPYFIPKKNLEEESLVNEE